MENRVVAGKSIEKWIQEYPLINDIIATKEVFWTNREYKEFEKAIKNISLNVEDVKDAEDRLNRFAPLIAQLFPETKDLDGIIESPIKKIPKMQDTLEKMYDVKIPGQILLKCDSHLAIAGSIKARGGIYEVLKHAEELALNHKMLSLRDDYSIMNSEDFRNFFGKYTIQVGSTGNLGLSIGIMSAKLGFKVIVHMSSDAKDWKKELLRSKGVEVVEYKSDYSKAVKEGRSLSDSNPMSYFIDDENSKDLFLGYSVAGVRLKKQLDEMNIIIDKDHPLFVYLPCGVGGGPGGVAFGLKLLYKDNIHFFFAEPTHSPCMLLGLLTDKHDEISVQDFGIDNITAADGLAVGRPSGFVGKSLKNLISGVYTVEDNTLYKLLSTLVDTEKIHLEPSALAGITGIINILKNSVSEEFLNERKLYDKMENSTHIVWATGGSLVPKNIMKEYYKKGRDLE